MDQFEYYVIGHHEWDGRVDLMDLMLLVDGDSYVLSVGTPDYVRWIQQLNAAIENEEEWHDDNILPLDRVDDIELVVEALLSLPFEAVHEYLVYQTDSDECEELLDAERFGDALALCIRTLAYYPYLSQWRVFLGQALQGLTRYDEALLAHDEATQLDPEDPAAHLGRGQALHELGHYVEALAAHDRAVQLDPSGHLLEAGAHIGRGDALLRLGRYDEALAAYDDTLRLDVYAPAARHGHAYALLGIERNARSSH